MPATKNASPDRLKQVVVGLWITTILCAVVVAAAWFLTQSPPALAFFSSRTPTPSRTPTASQTPTITLTPSLSPSPTISPSPTDSPTPTDTPAPSLTPSITFTPVPFSEGPIVIGYSVQKRALEVYRFGTGPTERLIVAGIHGGNEYNTVELADQLMAYITSNPGIIPADVTLYILRNLNPDGAALEHGPRGRANAHSVDLNRNWPANWQKTWPLAGCWTTTVVNSGTGPASEPETKALMGFIVGHKITAIINYHSAALGIFPGGIPISAGSKTLAQLLAAVTKYPYPPINTGCDYTGGFVDWSANLGIPSVDMELTNHTDTDFDKNLLALNVFLNWKP